MSETHAFCIRVGVSAVRSALVTVLGLLKKNKKKKKKKELVQTAFLPFSG